ncbi:MAG: ribosylnicotinamide kinase [Pycnora praestabilis]|nr:MAG: ribosylnicotinamide kinase [Pycnora praestabilis]
MRATIIGISGCSSSGKTTLSRLLRDILPNTFILHEDDFYKPEEELPMKHDLRDWDCVEALDIPAMLRALNYIHAHGALPLDLDSKEDKNETGDSGVSASTIVRMREEVEAWSHKGGGAELVGRDRPIAIIDGFLLYGNNIKDVREKLDIKLLLRVGYEKAKGRREKRSGYVTLEGFWEDPPGYVDKIVWPNYVQDHQFLFNGEDVEAEPRGEVLDRLGIQAQQGLDVDMSTNLRWAVTVVMKELEKKKGDPPASKSTP